MKLTLEFTLRGGIKLHVAYPIKTYADIGKLGRKLSSLVNAARKVIPDIGTRAVESVRIVKG